MLISELTAAQIADYLRIDQEDAQADALTLSMESARSYIMDYTGLTEDELDYHENLTLAYIILVQDMYDNRTMHPDTKYANSGNKTVETILDMHRRNLL